VRRRETEPDEAGITLVEVAVGMVLMSIFMAMFFGSITQVFRSVYRAQSGGLAQAQVNIAFLRLDREIRYAAAISTEGTMTGGDKVIEYLTTSGGTAKCTQLRLNGTTEQLQVRTWTQGASPLVPTAWIPLASQISSTAPFTFKAADSTLNFQQLELNVTATDGTGPGKAVRTSNVTFTALNTSLATSSVGVCTEGRLVP
jgi:Tfp pilus assembly protein PilV